jgi:4-aminobutyrate aminotransferase-like enzyme
MSNTINFNVGINEYALKIRCPLLFQREHVDTAIEKLDNVFGNNFW